MNTVDEKTLIRNAFGYLQYCELSEKSLNERVASFDNLLVAISSYIDGLVEVSIINSEDIQEIRNSDFFEKYVDILTKIVNRYNNFIIDLSSKSRILSGSFSFTIKQRIGLFTKDVKYDFSFKCDVFSVSSLKKRFSDYDYNPEKGLEDSLYLASKLHDYLDDLSIIEKQNLVYEILQLSLEGIDVGARMSRTYDGLTDLYIDQTYETIEDVKLVEQKAKEYRKNDQCHWAARVWNPSMFEDVLSYVNVICKLDFLRFDVHRYANLPTYKATSVDLWSKEGRERVEDCIHHFFKQIKKCPGYLVQICTDGIFRIFKEGERYSTKDFSGMYNFFPIKKCIENNLSLFNLEKYDLQISKNQLTIEEQKYDDIDWMVINNIYKKGNKSNITLNDLLLIKKEKNIYQLQKIVMDAKNKALNSLSKVKFDNAIKNMDIFNGIQVTREDIQKMMYIHFKYGFATAPELLWKKDELDYRANVLSELSKINNSIQQINNAVVTSFDSIKKCVYYLSQGIQEVYDVTVTNRKELLEQTRRLNVMDNKVNFIIDENERHFLQISENFLELQDDLERINDSIESLNMTSNYNYEYNYEITVNGPIYIR